MAKYPVEVKDVIGSNPKNCRKVGIVHNKANAGYTFLCISLSTFVCVCLCGSVANFSVNSLYRDSGRG